MLNRLSIRSKLALVAVMPLLAMAVLAALTWSTVKAVRVGSAAEQRVGDSYRVVADVLPPPLFVVEPFLTISLAAAPENAASRDALLDRYVGLEHEYRVHHRYWVEQSLPPALRAALLVESYETAQRFFGIVDDEIVPLIKAGDPAASSLISTKLVPVFEEHRNGILKVVNEARRYEADERAGVSDSVANRTTVFLAGLVLAMGLTLLLALVISRTIRESITRLRRAAEEDLPRVMAELRDADDDTLASARLEPVEFDTRDELADAADAFNAVLSTAVGLAAEQSVQRRHTAEMFVNLGRRNQNLVTRQLKFIDSLERTETDGERLAELFRLDNLATRMRRNAESLLVLAGVEAPRRWRKPVRLYDVVRGAMAEIEEFRRIEIVSFDDVLVHGASVSNVTHLLAELIENAARFSPPDSTVTVNGVDTGRGYLLGVHDRGLGMAPDALAAANGQLRTARRLDEVPTAYLGLFVVARLAAREGITVELESPEGDGLTAWVRVPVEALAAPEPEAGALPGAAEGAQGAGSLRRLELAARADQLAERPATAPPSAPPAPPAAAGLTVEPVDLPLAARPAAAPAAPMPPPVGLPLPAGALLPPPVVAGPVAAESSLGAPAPAAPAAPAATRSGFRKRTRSEAVVEFDRFDARTPPTGNRSAEDIKDRLDRFAAGKRFAAAQPTDPAEDDE